MIRFSLTRGYDSTRVPIDLQRALSCFRYSSTAVPVLVHAYGCTKFSMTLTRKISRERVRTVYSTIYRRTAVYVLNLVSERASYTCTSIRGLHVSYIVSVGVLVLTKFSIVCDLLVQL